MKIAETKKLQPLDRFLYWISERHLIYQRRQASQPKPWTDDEVLQNYFFTNPYRENDKVTQWFRENVREPLRDNIDVVFATIAFRWFNWIPTGEILQLHNLLVEWNLDKVVLELTHKALDEKVFTGAFNISASGSTKPKINRVCEDYIQPVWEDRKELYEFFETNGGRPAVFPMRMASAHSRLMQYPGLGGSGFMAYEIVCDLRYTKWLEGAPDKLTWSNPGPGAKRGLNRLLGRPLSAPVPFLDVWLPESQSLLAKTQEFLDNLVAGTLVPSRVFPSLEMREIEHSLCEFDKYCRALEGDGHMKRRYPGV